MRRWSIGAALLAAALAALWLGLAHARRSPMVRVGGMGNACACTHRIEP